MSYYLQVWPTGDREAGDCLRGPFASCKEAEKARFDQWGPCLPWQVYETDLDSLPLMSVAELVREGLFRDIM